MKGLVVSVTILALIVLVHTKSVSEVKELAEGAAVKVEQFMETAGVPMDPDVARLAADGLNIPILTRSCSNELCQSICNILGFAKGVCKSAVQCECSN